MNSRQLKMDAPLVSELFQFVLEDLPPKHLAILPHLDHLHHFYFVLGGHLSVLIEHNEPTYLSRGDGTFMPRYEYRVCS